MWYCSVLWLHARILPIFLIGPTFHFSQILYINTYCCNVSLTHGISRQEVLWSSKWLFIVQVMNSSKSYCYVWLRGNKQVSTECTSLPCGRCSKCAYLDELRGHHTVELTVWKLSFVSWDSDHILLCGHCSTLYLEILNPQTVKSIQKKLSRPTNNW